MDGKLKLNDLLQLSEDEIIRTKVKLNTYNGNTNPIDEFKKDPEILLRWNYWNNQKYKIGQISIGLVRMDTAKDEWLLFTVGRIMKFKNVPKDFDGVDVEYETYNKYKDLFGRVVIHYHNTAQNVFRNAKNIINDLEIKEILPSIYSGFDFPGYENVKLSFTDLETVINGNYPSYKNALRQQKAVYLITDTSNGKLYVGSATGSDMLLQRWTNYVKTGHGGNEGLKDLFDKKGFDYIKTNFQYTILENYNSRVDDEYVLERERYWKEVLCSTKFSNYNRNK